METDGLICACVMDGKGGAKELTWEEVVQWKSEQGPMWLHFDYTNTKAAEWISKKSGLDEVSASALLTEESRPRATLVGGGMLVALRGVNLNPGSDPEDMVAVRVWLDDKRIISTRKRKLLSETDIVKSFEEKQGPRTTGEFIVDLAERLISRMENTIEDIEDRVDDMEEEVIISENHALRTRLSAIRREAIMLRRYLAPQREAMIKLQAENLPWLSDNDKLHLRETTDRVIRYIEDLDSVRDRAAVTQEELVNRLSEQMNTRMYVLSIVAAVFLPLGFLTGLLGINVGGIPGAENKFAFFVFILMLTLVVILQIFIFKKKKWL
ncbi:MAG: zinc transporter ZntB [Desulfobacteraceae bacterium]|nr:MAG: zinc transporter ZntB [Desulfobacteraceae bacterium]